MYLGKEYTEEQINKMDCNDVNTLLNRYESVLSAQMTKSLGKSIINLYSNLACSVLGVGNQQELSTDLECDPFLYTEEQINKMDCNDVNTLLNRYESVLSAQMTKSLGKSIINVYSNLASSVLGVGNQQELSTDLECDPFLNTAMQRFTCDLYYRFGALLAPVSVGIITAKHYAKNSITKLNDRSDNGTCDPATRNCNQTEEPSEN